MLSNSLFRLSGAALPESRASKAWTLPGSDWSLAALERSTSVRRGNNSVGRRPSVVVNGLDKPLKTARADSDITPCRISFKRSTNSVIGDRRDRCEIGDVGCNTEVRTAIFLTENLFEGNNVLNTP